VSYGDFAPGANDGYVELLTGTGRPLQIIASLTQDSYQGDDLWLVKDSDEAESRVGFLQIGWGSCSGCDALADARGYYYDFDTPEHDLDDEDRIERDKALVRMDALRTQLLNDVKWFPTLHELLDWYEGRDWDALTYLDEDAVGMFRILIEEQLDGERV
jgi:hypothetical protein